MVTHTDVGRISIIIRNLTHVHLLCQVSNLIITPPMSERSGIFLALAESLKLAEPLFSDKDKLSHIPRDLAQWLSILNTEYRDKFLELGKKYQLDLKDAKKLQQSCSKWIKSIEEFYSLSPLAVLNEASLWRMYNEIIPKLDPGGKYDLKDAVITILSSIPTASVMLLNRVAEAMVIKLYKKIVGSDPPENSTWGTMENELKNHLRSKDPLLGLLQYRRGNRNTAQHSGKVYSQQEAEQTFMAVKELIDEIYSKL